LLDLHTEATQTLNRLSTHLQPVSHGINALRVRKSAMQSGKHIDKFFDGLIQDILRVHTRVKEKHREHLLSEEAPVHSDTLQDKYNKHCKK